jgi:hypothetical protein
MIESPVDSHTHLFFASQTPTLIPPEILSLLNCVVCHRFGSAAWAAHLQSHFAHSVVPLGDYAPKLGPGEALLFAPEGVSLGGDGDGARRWNGGCVRLKVARVKTREPPTPHEVENVSGVLSRPSIIAPLDAWLAANGTPPHQPSLMPQPQPAPLRRAITPQPGIPFKSPPLSFRHLDDDLKYLPAQRTASRGSSLHQTIPTMVYQHPPPPPHLAEQIHPTLEYPVRPSFVYGGSLIVDDQNDTASSTVPAADSIPIVSSQQNATLSTAKTLNFEPFIAAIKRARRSDEKQILRTDVGAHLSKADYEAIGLMGLKQTAQAAVTAGVIVTGGSENSAWIGLPEWFNPRLDDDLATARLTEPVASNRPPVCILGSAKSSHFDSFIDRGMYLRL